MQIAKNYDLTKLNTFGVKAEAKFFVEIKNEKDIGELFKLPEFKNSRKLFLGGGSNVLFAEDFDGIVVLNKLSGIEIVKEDSENVHLKAMGGEFWHKLVQFSVERGFWGLENMSLIPGTAGAAPVQNIGAYGSELKDVFESLEAYGVDAGDKKVFKKEECEFGYRTSIFKTKLKGKYFIASVTLKLRKNTKKNIGYKILRDYLEQNKIEVKSPKDVSEAVIAIRRSKLPDPALLGNAGSFFKNVFLDKAKMKSLLGAWPDMPYFLDGEDLKVPAGWLIEKCGPTNGTSWKGYREGNVGVHEKQALVLVNYGGATGKEIKDFSERIIRSVYEKFGLVPEREVNLI